ncbi:MAG: dephospho-CoA kinase [Candidatus Stahlbacteria bacterium]|nr:dephospho-CoA kinase [Candidatus Stahlbacteria bacterium]
MIIGITGGIGSGKSTVVGFFKEWGQKSVIEVDKLGWKILESKQKEIVEEFGDEILTNSKEVQPQEVQPQIDRKRLGQLIFASPDKIRKFNAIVHPPLIAELDRCIHAVHNLVVVDCALIYEWKIENWFDKIILVTSSYENKMQRLLESGYTKEEVMNRIHAQLPDEVKIADWVIENNNSLQTLRDKVKSIWELLCNK